MAGAGCRCSDSGAARPDPAPGRVPSAAVGPTTSQGRRLRRCGDHTRSAGRAAFRHRSPRRAAGAARRPRARRGAHLLARPNLVRCAGRGDRGDALGVRSLHPRGACHPGGRRVRARRHPSRLLTRPAGGRHLGARRRRRRRRRRPRVAHRRARARHLDDDGGPGPCLRPRRSADVGRRRLCGRPGTRCHRVGDHAPLGTRLVARMGDRRRSPDPAPTGHRGRPVPSRTASAGSGRSNRRPTADGSHATACEPPWSGPSSRQVWPPCC